jgi:pilus assembly protein CpaE
VASTTEILTLSDDPQLQGELQTAASALGEDQPRLRFVSDLPALMESIRSRPPALVLAPFGDKLSEMSNLARELTTSSPPIPLVAIFRPYGFGDDVSESGVLIEALRSGVRDFLRRPVSTTELRTLIESLTDGVATRLEADRAFGRVVSFISNKGGVGKSTLAVNAAVGLALRHPGRVLLIDASLQMGVASSLLNLQPESTLTDLAHERDRLDVTMIRQLAVQHPSGLALLAAPRDAVDAMEVDDTLIARVITLARRAYDYVIIDTFPMFDRVIVAALDLSDRAYVVMENVVPTLLGAVRLLDVLERIGFPAQRQGLIVNRQQRIVGNLSLDDIAVRMGRPIDHVLPFDKRVIAAANAGEPVALHALRFGGFSRGLKRLVAEIEAGREVRT